MFARFWSDRAGNFGLMFGLVSMPLLIAVGAAFDYSYSSTVKNQLQAAADAAAVGALSEQSVGVIASLKNGSLGKIDLGEADAKRLFEANLDPKYKAYLKSYSVSLVRSADKFVAQVTFAAKVPTSLLAVAGIQSVDVAGNAQANYVPASYIDFYMLLDNSPSMGLGATTADIQKLEANTSDKCAFACHESKKTDNYYTLAKSLGVATRIEVVSAAAQKMTDTASKTRKSVDQYRMAVYSLGASAETAKLTEVAAMSSNLDNVQDQTDTIDLMTTPEHNYNNDQQTDLVGSLTSLKTIMGVGGNGYSTSDRQKVLFLVTDGVEDVYRPDDCTQPTVPGKGRCQAPLDPAVCDQIKNNNIRIALLYTTYQPVDSNSWYTKYIAPFQSSIPNTIKACASDGLFFEVSPSDGIEEAMNALFYKVVNLPRLTM